MIISHIIFQNFKRFCANVDYPIQAQLVQQR
jgi:hypothetical protein